MLIDRALSANLEKNPWLTPYFRFAKLLAEFSTGRYENDKTQLSPDTLKLLVPGPPLLLAMAQNHLGQTDIARKTLDAAVAAYDWDKLSAINREVWIIPLLCREAKALLAP